MKRVVISIPVHESPVCVEQLVLNIKKFVPNSAVVLHASGSSAMMHSNETRVYPFVQQITNLTAKYPGFVFMNPHHYYTFAPDQAGCVTGLSTVHSSNFQYISTQMDFDVFAMNTSNDFFVRKGIEDLFEKYSCAFTPTHTPVDHFPSKITVDNLKKVTEIKVMEKGAQEGSFYPKEVFAEVAKKVNQISSFLDGEEGYLPSLAFNLFPELYDGCSNNHYVFHNPEHGAVERQDVERIRRGDSPNQYAVKRIPRQPDHPIRHYVNDLTKDD